MAIDHLTVKSYWEQQQSKAPPRVEYRTVSMDQVWTLFSEWLREQKEIKVKDVQDCVAALQLSGDYTYEGLVKRKALLDITQAELRIIESVTNRLHSFQQEPS